MKNIFDTRRDVLISGGRDHRNLHGIALFISRMARLAFLSVIAVVLTACATATGPVFSGVVPTSTESGDVYLYRTEAFFAALSSFSISLNGEPAGGLPNGSYLWFRMKPGFYTLRVDPGALTIYKELQFKVEPGQVRFYHYDFVTDPSANILFGLASIKPRDEAAAVKHLKSLKLANPGGAPIIWDRPAFAALAGC